MQRENPNLYLSMCEYKSKKKDISNLRGVPLIHSMIIS